MNVATAVIAYLLLAAGLGLGWLHTHREKGKLAKRLAGIVDLDAERAKLESANVNLRSSLETLQQEVSVLTNRREASADEVDLASVGFYAPQFELGSSERYVEKIEAVRSLQKDLLKTKAAAACRIEWQVNGSKQEGRKQIQQTLKLMLRAFNGECDAAIANVTYKNVQRMKERIENAAEAINELVQVQQCSISEKYTRLKLDELHLTFEHEEKLQSEREEQKRVREQMRDEEVARRELERAKLEAEREERRCEDALSKAREEVSRAQGAQHDRLTLKIAELEQRLSEVKEKERAISRAQLTRAGHVYVISNLGSFGDGVFKIGMTRRLVPQDRIDELGDASVPFEFDVHAIISTEDAPALETALHRCFSSRRVNRVNERKEFFRVTLEEIASAVRSHHGDFEFVRGAEAEDFRKSLAMGQHEASEDRAAAPVRRVA